MSSRALNRKEFLILTVSVAAGGALAGCSDDPAPAPGGTSGSGGTGAGSGGMAGTSTGGTTAGTTTGGSSAGSGTAGNGGTSGGSAGSSAGGGGAGGTSGGGGAGGSAGSGGNGGGGGSGGAAGGMCGTADIQHTSNNQHTHIPGDATMLKMDLAAHINGDMATMAFELPEDAGHTHTITLTAEQVTTLKGGGMVTGIVSSNDSNHMHTYTVSCSA